MCLSDLATPLLLEAYGAQAHSELFRDAESAVIG
jgi:hypothetical protein